jgi:hypothetical protein
MSVLVAADTRPCLQSVTVALAGAQSPARVRGQVADLLRVVVGESDGSSGNVISAEYILF